MSPREARIARDLARKLRENEKSARLRERVNDDEVRVGATVKADKSIRTGANPGSIFDMQMSWTCDAPDCEGAWSWGTERQWSEQSWSETIEPKLREWERLKWREIDTFSSGSGHKMHHNMGADVICPEAQERLDSLQKYGDDIFRFRLGNRRRLWGFRIVAKFEILWFDPHHEIYPTDPE